jgi:hypothetical protein
LLLWRVSSWTCQSSLSTDFNRLSAILVRDRLVTNELFIQMLSILHWIMIWNTFTGSTQPGLRQRDKTYCRRQYYCDKALRRKHGSFWYTVLSRWQKFFLIFGSFIVYYWIINILFLIFSILCFIALSLCFCCFYFLPVLKWNPPKRSDNYLFI